MVEGESGLKVSNDKLDLKEDDLSDIGKIWASIVKNNDWINYAQISNSFVLLMALNEAGKPLTAGELSEVISQRSKGRLFKIPSTVKDALEYRLKREGLVKDEITNSPTSKTAVSRYSITVKGQKLLKGWISFITAFK